MTTKRITSFLGEVVARWFVITGMFWVVGATLVLSFSLALHAVSIREACLWPLAIRPDHLEWYGIAILLLALAGTYSRRDDAARRQASHNALQAKIERDLCRTGERP
jgi:hypothetical protein